MIVICDDFNMNKEKKEIKKRAGRLCLAEYVDNVFDPFKFLYFFYFFYIYIDLFFAFYLLIHTLFDITIILFINIP